MGYEVIGISPNEQSDPTEEEMLLEIGRNSNFAKMSLNTLGNRDFKGEVLIYSFFDFYLAGKEYLLKENGDLHVICEKLFSDNCAERIVLLLPKEMEKQEKRVGIEAFACAVLPETEKTKNILIIYMPLDVSQIETQSSGREKIGLEKGMGGEETVKENTLKMLNLAEAADWIAEAIEREEDGIWRLERGRRASRAINER
ncbi:hypothetical protein [Neobacillus notoginsengisoli]|nr:hypothetical protein [Neobacillus notoginsengisoli]